MPKDSRRIMRGAHNDVLGGKRQASKLRHDAIALRRKHGACEHGDEEKVYASSEESQADTAPNITCPACQKPKLRVGVIVRGGAAAIPAEHAWVIGDLLK